MPQGPEGGVMGSSVDFTRRQLQPIAPVKRGLLVRRKIGKEWLQGFSPGPPYPG